VKKDKAKAAGVKTDMLSLILLKNLSAATLFVVPMGVSFYYA